MDPDAVRDRAEVGRLDPVVLDSDYWAADEPKWVAEDPETGCRGVGEFEAAALTNLVYAVEAYHADPGSAVGYISVGPEKTYRMRWLDDDSTLLARLRRLLPI